MHLSLFNQSLSNPTFFSYFMEAVAMGMLSEIEHVSDSFVSMLEWVNIFFIFSIINILYKNMNIIKKFLMYQGSGYGKKLRKTTGLI